jgi:hypothetical protein
MLRSLPMKRRIAALLILGLLAACSNNASAPPAPRVCSAMPDTIACRTASGECVALTCVNEFWQCAAGETVIVLAPGRCTNDDAGADAGGNGDAGEA